MNLVRVFLGLLFYISTYAGDITQVTIQGTISPAQSDYLKTALDHAQANKAAMVLILLDTPGGLYTSTREMIQTIANSTVPVCIYVAPKGAHAASAGTYLLYAAQSLITQFLQTFKEYPPRMKPASFTVDQAMQKLQEGLGSNYPKTGLAGSPT